MIAKYQLDPARCWMVGDRITDWDAGKNAGIHSCAVRSGAGQPEDFAYAESQGFVQRADFPEFVRIELGLKF